MELILIACSKGKLAGGERGYQHSKRLRDAFGEATYNRLIELRHELVSRCEKPLPRGPDLGFNGNESTAVYMPAYLRYTGKVYRVGRVKERYPGNKNVRLVIISAMYGLLDAGDLIQNYDLKMDDKVSNIHKNTWWKRQGLGNILEKYILACRPVTIHDLLPNNYRAALEPWPPNSIRNIVKQYNFPPGLPWEVNGKRGEILAQLLQS
jgi:hypothetical protein